MKIITDNEVIVQGEGDYSDANDGKLKGKAKDLVGSGKVKGLLDLFGGGNTGNTGAGYTQPDPTPLPVTKKKMSTTTKVLIGVGALALVGGIIYLVTRKKGKK
mgnify:CR=1 FL=1